MCAFELEKSHEEEILALGEIIRSEPNELISEIKNDKQKIEKLFKRHQCERRIVDLAKHPKIVKKMESNNKLKQKIDKVKKQLVPNAQKIKEAILEVKEKSKTLII